LEQKLLDEKIIEFKSKSKDNDEKLLKKRKRSETDNNEQD